MDKIWNIKFIKLGWPLGLIWFMLIIFFFPVWGQGKNVIPADTLTGLYHPFRDYVATDYPNGTPYKNFLITDAVRQQYVYRQFSVDQLQQGQIPWWNSYNSAGTPHLAGMQAASFYPLNIIFWLTDFTLGWNLLVMSQMFLGSLWMFLYLHNLKLKPLAAGFGSLVWIFSGFYVAWLVWNTAVHVALWSPLILLALDKIIIAPTSNSKTKMTWIGVLVFGLGAQFYGGYPQPWLYLSLVQVSYAVLRLLSSYREIWKKMGGVVISYVVFGLLALPQLVATLEFSNLSNRLADQGDLLVKPDWFIPYPQLLQLVIPDFFGNPSTLNYWGIFNYTEFVSYVGVIAAAFVLVTWFSRPKRKIVWFFGVWVGIALLLALRNPISELQFKYQLPFVSGSQPSRWIVVINLGLAILAGFGFDLYLRGKANLIKPMIICGAILTIGWLWVLNPVDLEWFEISQQRNVAQRNLLLPTLELLGLIIVSGITYILQSQAKSLTQKFHLLAVIGLFGFAMLTGLRFAHKFIPFTNPDWLYPETATTKFLQESLGDYRYMTTDRRLMPPNINMAYKLSTIEGYDPLYLEKYGRLITAADTLKIEVPPQSRGFNRYVYTNNFDSTIVSLLGVKYILSLSQIDNSQFQLVHQEGETLVYENLMVYPRAFIVSDIDNFPPLTYQPAEIIEYTPSSIKIRFTTTQSGYLVLTDSWYPHWQAKLNGQSVDVIDYFGLRATIIPEGTHEIIYQYRHSYL